MHGENVVVPFLILLSPLLGVPFNAAAAARHRHPAQSGGDVASALSASDGCRALVILCFVRFSSLEHSR
jgi:hypothetical protein